MIPLRKGTHALSASRRTLVAAAMAAGALAGTAPIAGAQATAWHETGVGSEWELYLRALTARGLVEPGAWSARPLAPHPIERMAARIAREHPWASRLPRTDSLPAVAVLRPAVSGSYNSGFAWGMHDGAVWQGRGVNAWATAGARAQWRWFSARLEPLVQYAANQAFELRPPTGDPVSAEVFGIDLPQRFGDAPVAVVDPGQSFARVDVGPLGAAFSTENLAWGPGIRHGLVFGPNAGGFPHLRVGTNRPVRTPIGSFGLNVVYGSLRQTDWAPATDHPRRFGTGFVALWVPFDLPIEVGATRFYHRAWPDSFARVDLLAPFGSWFRDDQIAGTGMADNQLASAFATIRVPALGLEMFGEFGRNDRSEDTRDLLVEPEHNAAWMFGVLHVSMPDSLDGHFWTTRLEVVNARVSRIADLGRGQAIFYTHSPIVQGHTERGQLLGTPLAEQSGGIELAVDRWARWGRIGGSLLERQLPGDVLVGMAAWRPRTQWELAVSTTVFRDGHDLSARLGHVWDLNRFVDRDVRNLQLQIGARAALPRALSF